MIATVDPPRRLHPLLDHSVPLTGAPDLRKRDPLHTGRGVMIAVIDTGLDLRHADFRDAAGHTRVRWLLDAAAPRAGRHPELPDYGGMALFTGAEIDAVLQAEAAHLPPPPDLATLTETDRNGHGTHVAGIAAANGLATGAGKPAGRYVGMAPEASLCVVQATRDGPSFADADVVAGVRFCLDRARDDGVPVVVNLSLGAAGGAHDGSTALEQALDQLFAGRDGAALVVAAGNSGGRDIHAGGYLLDGEATLTLTLDAVGAGQAAIEIYDQGGPLTLALTSPAGRTLGPVSPGEDARDDLGAEGRVALASAAPGPQHSATLVISGAQAPAPGPWLLRLRGTAQRYDVWVGDTSDKWGARLAGHLDIDTQVEMPATAHQAISVGSFTSRAEWPRFDGGVARRTVELLAPSLFTSAGPGADGRFLPDLAAPGEFVVSALSRDALPADPGSAFHDAADPGLLWADDGVHGVLRGTSQAAPHVSGAVALLMQADARLGGERLRELLRTTAQGALGYSTRVGFGWLNVDRAARVLSGEKPGGLSPRQSAVGVNRDVVPPGTGLAVVTVVPRDRDGLPLGPGVAVAVQSSAGTWMGPVQDLGSGRYERVLRADGPRGTVAQITATVAGVAIFQQPQVLFAGERSEAGAPYQAASGCAAGRQPRGGEWGLWLVLPGLALLRRRRQSCRPRRGKI